MSSHAGHEHHHHPRVPPRDERAVGTHAQTTLPPVPSHEHGAHDRHAGHSVEMFRDRFWITLALTIPTLVWSHMIQEWFGFRAPSIPGAAYVTAVFGPALELSVGGALLAGACCEL